MEAAKKSKKEISFLFLSDLDGTLIHKDLEISREDEKAIASLQESGNLFGLVTGRDRVFCENLLQRYGLRSNCLITCNGAMTYWNQNRMDASLIDLDVSISIFKELTKYEDIMFFFTAEDGRNYFPVTMLGSRFKEIQSEFSYLGNVQNQDVFEYLNTRNEGCAKISVCTYTKENNQKYLPIFQSLFNNVEVLPTSFDYIEMTKKDTDKSRAMKKMIESQHLNIEDIVFIGDGLNDVSLFDMLNHTYVMDSASDEVKAHANTIVSSVSEAIQIEREKRECLVK